MANKIYPKFKEYMLDMVLGAGESPADPVVKVCLVDLAGYTYDDAHDFLADVDGGSRENISAALAGKTFTDGVFDANDTLFTTETGDPSEALIYFIDTGDAATSRLIYYCDTATGLPVTPNGANISLTFDNGANKIFKI